MTYYNNLTTAVGYADLSYATTTLDGTIGYYSGSASTAKKENSKSVSKSSWNWIPAIKGIYPQKDKRMVVVKFSDNSIVKLHCHEEDTFNVEIATALAISYKFCGGKKNEFRKMVKEFTKGE